VSAHLSIVLLLKQPARVLSRVIRVHFFQLQMQQKILRKPKNRAIYLSTATIMIKNSNIQPHANATVCRTSKRKTGKAFTLIELLVVIAIILISMVPAGVEIVRSRRKSPGKSSPEIG